MSPEQARGEAVDARGHLGFGCLLFELVTGRRVFGGGRTAADTIASVLSREPD